MAISSHKKGMITFQKSIFVNRPVETIFKMAIDNDHFASWMPGLVFSKMSSSGEFGVGTTFVQRLQIGSQNEDILGRVVDFQANRRWAYTGLGENFCLRRMWSFERLSKGTRINFYEELSPRKRLSLYFNFLLRLKTAKTNGQSLELLKLDLENHHVPAPVLSHR